MYHLWTKTKHSLIETTILFVVVLVFAFGLKVAQPNEVFAAAGINQQLNYQGKLMTSAGVQVSDSNWNFRFRVYSAASGGTPVWVERWTATTTRVSTVNGVFSVALGTIGGFSTSSINWNSDSLYLQVDLDADNNGSWEETFSTRKRLTSSAYAFNADTVDGIHATSTAAVANYLMALDANKVLNLYDGGVSSTRATTTQFVYIAPSAEAGSVTNLDRSGGDLYVADDIEFDSELFGNIARLSVLNATTTNIGALTVYTGSTLNGLTTATDLRATTLNATSTTLGSLTGYGLGTFADFRPAVLNASSTTVGTFTAYSGGVLNGLFTATDFRPSVLNASTTNVGTLLGYGLANFTDLRTTNLNASSTANFLNILAYGNATTSLNLFVGGFASTTNLVLGNDGANLGTYNDIYVSGSELFFNATQITGAAGIGGTSGAWQSTFGGLALTPTSTTAGIFVNASSTINANFRVTGNATTTGNFAVASSTAAASGLPALFVDSLSGFVGVGTNAPSNALEVVGHLNLSGGMNRTINSESGDLVLQGSSASPGEADIRVDLTTNNRFAVRNANDIFTVGFDGNATTTGWFNIGTTAVGTTLGSLMGAGDLYVGADATITNSISVGTLTAGQGIVGGGTTGPLTSTSTWSVVSGGTGAVTLGVNQLLLGGGTSPMTALTAGTDGQLLVGQTSAAPAFTTISGQASVTALGVWTNSDLTCTDCIGVTEIADSYLLNTGDDGVGLYTLSDLRLANGLNASSTANFFNIFAYNAASTTDSLSVGGYASTSKYFIAGNSLNKTVLQSGDIFASGGLYVTNNATTSGWFNIGTTAVGTTLGSLIGAGDLFVGDDATVTGSLAVGSLFSIKDSTASTTGSLVIGTALNSIRSLLGAGDLFVSRNATITEGFIADAGTLFVDANNNKVGIGTTTPSDLLTLEGSAGASIMLSGASNPNAVDKLLGEILFDSSRSSILSSVDASVMIQGWSSEAHSSIDKGGYLTISTKPTDTNQEESAVERLRVTAAGLVGINISSPTSTLSVGGNADFRGNATTTGWFNIGTTAVGTTLGSLIGAGDLFVGSDATITRSLTVDGGTLFVDADNNRVGVNVSNPAYPLQVLGTSYLNGTVYVDGTIQSDNATDDLSLGSFGSTWVTIKNTTGRVGVGTITPTELFEIEGSGTATSSISSSDTNILGGEVIGTLAFKGRDDLPSTSRAIGAMIKAVANGTGWSANTFPGSAGADLWFITEDGTTTALEQNSGPAMVIMGTGRVGIGTTTPSTIIGTAAQLDVVAQTGYGIWAESTGATTAVFNRQASDGTIISISQANIEEGTISVSGTTVSYNAFTGSHYAWTDETIERGMIVSLTGVNRNLHDTTESEPIYGVRTTTKANDSKIMGSYLSLLNPSLPISNENPVLVMAVGNGDVWIADTGENIEPGDLLISSDVPGHAIKDPEIYDVTYIVARAAEPIDWSTVSETINGIKHKKVTVFFENFVRDRRVPNVVERPDTTNNYTQVFVVGNPEQNVSSIVVREAAEFQGTVYVRGEAWFETNVTFGGDINVRGRIFATLDQAGTIVIPAGATSTEVIFNLEYEVVPKVVASFVDDDDSTWVTWKISNKRGTGFRIVVREPAQKDLNFDWLAFPVVTDGQGAPPVINELVTSLETVAAGNPVELWAKVTDNDTKDKHLSYTWRLSPNIGSIEGDSGLVYWTVSDGEVAEDTDVTVTVTVTDGGHITSKTTKVRVLAGSIAGVSNIQETAPPQNEETNDTQPSSTTVTPEPTPILGCLDQTATNYNANATQDDGSCAYPQIEVIEVTEPPQNEETNDTQPSSTTNPELAPTPEPPSSDPQTINNTETPVADGSTE